MKCMSESATNGENRKMTNAPDITSLISDALEELNQLMLPENRVKVSPDLELFGNNGALDSLALVNLVVILEDQIYSKYNIEISLAGDQVNPQQTNPFKNVKSLSEHILKLVQNRNN